MACCNVLVVGGKGVGKTSLVNTFLSGTFKKVKHNNVEIFLRLVVIPNITEFQSGQQQPRIPKKSLYGRVSEDRIQVCWRT